MSACQCVTCHAAVAPAFSSVIGYCHTQLLDTVTRQLDHLMVGVQGLLCSCQTVTSVHNQEPVIYTYLLYTTPTLTMTYQAHILHTYTTIHTSCIHQNGSRHCAIPPQAQEATLLDAIGSSGPTTRRDYRLVWRLLRLVAPFVWTLARHKLDESLYWTLLDSYWICTGQKRV